MDVVVGKLLCNLVLRLTAADSCTGGFIGHLITNLPDFETYYMGSVTACAHEAKVPLLGVRCETLEKHDAVSKETVLEMACGLHRAMAADIGVSVSSAGASPTSGAQRSA